MEIVGSKRSRNYYWLGVAVFLIVVIAATAYYFIGRTRVIPPGGTAKRPSGLLPTPTGATMAIAPWIYADTPLMQEPPMPAADQLNLAYLKVRGSIAKRDYSAFKAQASAQFVWNQEHVSRYLGEASDGHQTFQLLGLKGEDAFRIYAPYSIPFLAPPADDLVPGEVKKSAEPNNDDQYYYLDNDNQVTYKVAQTNYRYRVELGYVFETSVGDKGKGGVSFVYDKDRWAYAGEYWKVSPHEGTFGYGDTADNSTTIHEIKVNPRTGACDPQSATIKKGESLVWKNITGKIYSIEPQSGYWESPQLYHNDSYTKIFNDPGRFTYLAQVADKIDIDINKCFITVN